MGIRCFFLEPTEEVVRSLRRYTPSATCRCPGELGYHDASRRIDVIRIPVGQTLAEMGPDRADTRWPTRCAAAGCDYAFIAGDEFQVSDHRLYRRSDDGKLITLHDAPIGAMWFATWLEEYPSTRRGPDGRILIVKTPGGTWNIDSRCSNCTRRDDDVHRCWIRHGAPPLVTVDKNGDTCSAGAGSIVCGGYHGFLRNGELVEA